MDEYAQIVRLWQQYAIGTEADIDLRLDSFRILFAYHSGKIENPEISYHDTREIFENGRVVNFTGSPRTIFEQRNQKLCYDFLKPRIIARKPITIALIKETHAILTAGIAIQLAIGCFADGWNRSAPYLAVVDRCRSAWLSEPNRNVWVYGCLRSQPCAVHLQVVLAHPPESLALFQRAPSGRYSDGWVFGFQGTRGGR